MPSTVQHAQGPEGDPSAGPSLCLAQLDRHPTDGTPGRSAVASLAGLGIATMVWSVTAVTTRQAHTPDHLLGRVSSAFYVIGAGTTALTAPVGGVIAALTDTRWALAAAAGLCAAAVPILATQLPHDVQTTPTEQPPP